MQRARQARLLPNRNKQQALPTARPLWCSASCWVKGTLTTADAKHSLLTQSQVALCCTDCNTFAASFSWWKLLILLLRASWRHDQRVLGAPDILQEAGSSVAATLQCASFGSRSIPALSTIWGCCRSSRRSSRGSGRCGCSWCKFTLAALYGITVHTQSDLPSHNNQ